MLATTLAGREILDTLSERGFQPFFYEKIERDREHDYYYYFMQPTALIRVLVKYSPETGVEGIDITLYYEHFRILGADATQLLNEKPLIYRYSIHFDCYNSQFLVKQVNRLAALESKGVLMDISSPCLYNTNSDEFRNYLDDCFNVDSGIRLREKFIFA